MPQDMIDARLPSCPIGTKSFQYVLINPQGDLLFVGTAWPASPVLYQNVDNS